MTIKEIGVEHQPSKTAINTAYLRAIASKKFKDSKWGADYLSICVKKYRLY